MSVIVDSIKKHKIIAIVRNLKPGDILVASKALYNGGIRLMEVTFNQSSATGEQDTEQSIRIINEYFGDKVDVGAGTVMTVKQVEIAIKAGAKYIISPNTNLDVMKKTIEMGAISIPGAFTPSEIIKAYENGAGFVKIFPAGALGTDYIKAIRSPISHIPLLAVGGVNDDNLKDYMACSISGVGIGSSLVSKRLIEEGKFEELAYLAKRYTSQL